MNSTVRYTIHIMVMKLRSITPVRNYCSLRQKSKQNSLISPRSLIHRRRNNSQHSSIQRSYTESNKLQDIPQVHIELTSSYPQLHQELLPAQRRSSIPVLHSKLIQKNTPEWESLPNNTALHRNILSHQTQTSWSHEVYQIYENVEESVDQWQTKASDLHKYSEATIHGNRIGEFPSPRFGNLNPELALHRGHWRDSFFFSNQFSKFK